MRAIKKGFTLVELLVVISVISILASISFIAYQQFNVSANDSSRKSQVTSIVKALEKYFQTNGSYPNCNALSGDPATIISTLGLTGLKPSVFKAPGDTASNSIQCGGSSATNKFVYSGDGSTECTNNTSPCGSFSLQYKEEGSGNTITVAGQYSAQLSSNTILTLNQPSQGTGCTLSDFTSLALSWSISGSTSAVTAFEIQASTENTFTSGLVSISGSTSVYVTNPAATSYTYTNNTFTPGTTYFFRVRAVTGTSPNYSAYSFWSSTKSQSPRNDALTLSLNPAAATSSSLSISSWGTNACAAEYVLSRSTSSSMTSPTNTTYATSTTFPVSVTGLAAGTTYYFKIKFNVVAGGASGYVSRQTPLATIRGTSSSITTWYSQVFASSTTSTSTSTWTKPAGVSTVEVLVVGGGGSGGGGYYLNAGGNVSDFSGGGGGAGGVVYASSVAVSGNQTVTAGGTNSSSSFGSLVVANAGGQGAAGAGNSGGSGGGGAYDYETIIGSGTTTTVGSGGAASAGTGGTGYAFAGGGSSIRSYSGGGGGSGAIGGSASGTTSGSGGIGKTFYWTDGTSGSAINTTSGTSSITVAGGGGGGAISAGTAGPGFTGGGNGGLGSANGSAASITSIWNGTTGSGYGSGGGGGGRGGVSNTATSGGSGSQGIVIVRWLI